VPPLVLRVPLDLIPYKHQAHHAPCVFLGHTGAG
jgi:hypothetical protein